MPIEHVSRSISIDDLLITVEVDRWICDDCGRVETFPDIPPVEGMDLRTPSLRGWRISYFVGNGDGCRCPRCIGDDEVRDRTVKDRAAIVTARKAASLAIAASQGAPTPADIGTGDVGSKG